MDHNFFRHFMRAVGAAALLFAAAGGVAAQQGPPMSYGEQVMQLSDDECMRRAPRVLRQEGYRTDSRGNNSVYGTKRNHSAYILCVSDRDRGFRDRVRVITIVASRAGGDNVPAAERVVLERAMDRPGGGGGGPGCGLARRITEYENGFTGIWTRRGGNRSTTYDAIWTRGSERAEAVLDIQLVGNRVTVQRTDAAWMGGNTCTYYGTMNGDRITGSYSCRVGGTNMQWEATVECE